MSVVFSFRTEFGANIRLNCKHCYKHAPVTNSIISHALLLNDYFTRCSTWISCFDFLPIFYTINERKKNIHTHTTTHRTPFGLNAFVRFFFCLLFYTPVFIAHWMACVGCNEVIHKSKYWFTLCRSVSLRITHRHKCSPYKYHILWYCASGMCFLFLFSLCRIEWWLVYNSVAPHFQENRTVPLWR